MHNPMIASAHSDNMTQHMNNTNECNQCVYIESFYHCHAMMQNVLNAFLQKVVVPLLYLYTIYNLLAIVEYTKLNIFRKLLSHKQIKNLYDACISL